MARGHTSPRLPVERYGVKDATVDRARGERLAERGVEGVHEVLASEFDAILCDMQMPTLPGDMFYRAVERMRPRATILTAWAMRSGSLAILARRSSALSACFCEGVSTRTGAASTLGLAG